MKRIAWPAAGILVVAVAATSFGGDSWKDWKGKWEAIRATVTEDCRRGTEACSESVHEYWSEHAGDWKSRWDGLKQKSEEIWRNQIDPMETWTEEVLEAAKNPETSRRIVDAAMSADGKSLLVEKLRFVPVYDPYTRKVRTLDAMATDLAERHADYLKGSSFAEDPGEASALVVMLDRDFLWNARILRKKSGEWISVREALNGEAERAVAVRLQALHESARSALQGNQAGECTRLLSQFSDVVAQFNRGSLPAAGSAQPADPPTLLSKLEQGPVELLRDGESFRSLGKTQLALEKWRAVLEQYPHSGFADDALIALAQDDFDGGDLDTAIRRLNTFVERYVRSDLCDKALYLLARCYEARVQPTDVQRLEALRGYKEILREFEEGSKDWKGEVIELVLNKEKAIRCYGLLRSAFPDSPYAEEAEKRRRSLEGR